MYCSETISALVEGTIDRNTAHSSYHSAAVSNTSVFVERVVDADVSNMIYEPWIG